MKTTKDKAIIKEKIKQRLFMDSKIQKIMLNDSNMTSKESKLKAFNDVVKSHLFIDDTLVNEGTYIFFDTLIHRMSSSIKNLKVVMYIVSHRNILDDIKEEGYHGNRADILSQMVEDALINDKGVAKSFGIGDLNLDSIDIYNAKNHYGYIMTFSVPNFR